MERRRSCGIVPGSKSDAPRPRHLLSTLNTTSQHHHIRPSDVARPHLYHPCRGYMQKLASLVVTICIFTAYGLNDQL